MVKEKEFCKQQIIDMVMEIDDLDLIKYINEYIRLLKKETEE